MTRHTDQRRRSHVREALVYPPDWIGYRHGTYYVAKYR